MKFYRPASVLHVLLLAFSLVGLPLIFALVIAIVSVDRLAARSQQAVLDAARIVQSGRMLTEEVTAMERNARQFQLLGDRSLHEVYLKRRAQFAQSIQTLALLNLNRAQRVKLNKLVAQEDHVYETLRQFNPDSDATIGAVEQFPSLSQLARSILSDSSRSIGREVHKMRREAARVQHLLFWQAAALIPAVLILALAGTMLIAKPIRQIDQAIRRLGQGEFSSPIKVTGGPQDFEELGAQLEWMRKRLVELDEEKTKFLRHVSHELKTPLTAIREGAELLNDELVGTLNETQTDIAQILCKNSLQLQKRIEDLLSFSFITQAPKLFINEQTIQLNRLVETVVSNQKVPLQAKRLRVETALNPARVQGDREKLAVVLDNLLSNAIKYSPRDGRIQVTLDNQNHQAILEVQDQGPGIAPQERDKVFNPFYQGRAVYSGHIKGTGLGLAIAQEYVKAHNGTIQVMDQTRGARLRVALPLKKAKTDIDQGSSPG